MAKFLAVLKRMPRIAWLLLVVQAVLIVALVMSSGALMRLGVEESKRANASGQRVIIDAETGVVSGMMDAKKSPEFDVAPEKKPVPEKEEKKETVKNSEEKPQAPAKEEKTPEAAPAEEKKEATKETTSPTPAPDAKSDAPTLQTALEEPAISSIPQGKGSLAAAPAPEVTDETELGALPKRGKDGLTPAKLYAREHEWKKNTPAIGVVVVGLGQDAVTAASALALPEDITLSFSPYGPHSKEWAESARNRGQEVWLDLPVQTMQFPIADPGPLGLFKGLSHDELVRRMQKTLQAFPGFVGVVLPGEQAVLEEPTVIGPILDETIKRGLRFAAGSSNVTLDRISHLAAVKKHVILADIWADRVGSRMYIESNLRKAEEQSMGGKRVIVILRATPLSMEVLSAWVASLAKRDIDLAPLSAFAHD